MQKSQLALLRSSAVLVAADADKASGLFYQSLFAANPELKQLFATEMGGQKKRLMQMIDTAVFGLDKPAMLIPLLKQLGQRHVAYGVVPEHYPLVGKAFLHAIEQTLGSQYTPEVRDAWQAFYELAAQTMLDGSREVREVPIWEQAKV